jgi:hypothetical protein
MSRLGEDIENNHAWDFARNSKMTTDLMCGVVHSDYRILGKYLSQLARTHKGL